MDGSPFRVPSPADRRVTSRQPEPTPVRPEPTPDPDLDFDLRDPEPPRSESRRAAAHRPAASHHAEKAKRPPLRFRLPIIIASLLLVAALGWAVWSGTQGGATGIDRSKYQAVFFTNGQVYFGKLSSANKDYMKLTDIYYLQAKATSESESENPQETTTNQNDVQLIKLGDEIHGPEDEMIISKEQVLFYENIKEDGKVAQSIEQYKKAN